MECRPTLSTYARIHTIHTYETYKQDACSSPVIVKVDKRLQNVENEWNYRNINICTHMYIACVSVHVCVCVLTYLRNDTVPSRCH